MSWRTVIIAIAFIGSALAQNAAAPAEQALFEKLPVVEAAALHQQTLEEAPANVTVITAGEMRKYGYRTLGEALNSVVGFYVTSDRIYNYVGVRGFSLPGDFNTRFLVMIDGHAMTEHVYGSNNFFGQDFGLDMDLVERIEIIRGPTSALYGSSGILANINIVTKSPVDFDHWRASTETGSFGERKATVSSALYLGRGANLLTSASVFNNGGQDYFFPEFNRPATNNGWARGVDGERGYHAFANLIWRDWSFLASLSSREKQPPVAWDSDALFDDPGAQIQDRRGFVGVSYKHSFGDSELRWRLFYDEYRYDERFDYAVPGGGIEDLRNIARNDWLDTELSYRFQTGRSGALTVGVEGSIDLRNLQRNYIRSPQTQTLLTVDTPDREGAIFAQEEWKLSSRWSASFGLRFDANHYFDKDVSPRLALVYRPGQRTVWKFVYGRAFRNPSVYEQYFQDGLALISAQKLRPETGHTIEASVERKVRNGWSATASAYYYSLNNLIAVYSPTGLPPGQYQNVAGAHAFGTEVQIAGALPHHFEISASVALQQTRTAGQRALPDSPHQVHKARIGMPLFAGKIFISSAVSYEGDRWSLGGLSTGSALVTDFTFSTLGLSRQFDLQAGLRNAFNDRYYAPVGLAVDHMLQDARSAYLKLIWHAKE